MMVSTTDPITLQEIADPEQHPFVIKGEGRNAVKIYFESEETRQAYIGNAAKHPDADLTSRFDHPRPRAGGKHH